MDEPTPQHRSDRPTATDRLAFAACALGLTASLLPWLVHAAGWSPHRTHSDLWFAFGVMIAASFAEAGAAGRTRRVLRVVLGLAAVFIAAVNAPDLLRLAERAGEPGTAGFLGDAAVQRLYAYGAVAAAGLTLAVCGLAASGRPKAPPRG